jgi:hypothetical protein
VPPNQVFGKGAPQELAAANFLAVWFANRLLSLSPNHVIFDTLFDAMLKEKRFKKGQVF